MLGTILHTINQSPFNKSTLQECINFYQQHDAIILLENGVYGALSSQPLASELQHKTCYALRSDLDARGLNNREALLENIHTIDYPQFVQLVTEYDKVQSWY